MIDIGINDEAGSRVRLFLSAQLTISHQRYNIRLEVIKQ